MHLEIQRGGATEEILIPFQEIQQIQLKHKDT
jgi:antitoxin component of MazEF toxin-antitoxin module